MQLRFLRLPILILALPGLSALAADAPAAGETPPPPPTRIERPRVQPVQPAAPAQTLQPARPGVPVTPAKPPANTQTSTSVDVTTVLKNQLHQCEQDLLQCDGENDGLRQQVQTLKTQIGMQQMQIAQLQAKLDETVHPGGSLVKAWCESNGVSRNTAGASSDCGADACEPVSGLCRVQCNASAECREPTGGITFVCDTMTRQCVNANQ